MSICYKPTNIHGASIFRAYSKYYFGILYIAATISLSLPFAACGEHYDFEGTDDFNWSDCDGTCEGIGWYQDTSTGYNSNSSLRSGPIEYQDVSCICKNVSGRAKITFYWKSDTTFKDGSQLLFVVDDDVKRIYNTYGWRFESYSIRCNGNHTIKWVFRKFRFLPQWRGAGWIDNVNISLYGEEIANTPKSDDKPSVNVNERGNGKNNWSNTSIRVFNEIHPDLDIMGNKFKFPIGGKISDKYFKNPLIAHPNVVIDNSANVHEATPRSNITFNISITNTGDVDLYSVIVSYKLHYGMNYVRDTLSDGKLSGNDIIWNLGHLKIGETKFVELVTNINGLGFGSLNNRASVSGSYSIGDFEYNVTDEDTEEVLIPVFYVKENSDGKYNFSSIDEAVRTVFPYGIIHVEKNYCKEPTIIINKPLNLVGIGCPLIENNDTGNQSIIIVTNTSEVLIDSFNINGLRKQHCIVINNAGNISITNTTMFDIRETGILIYNSSNITIFNDMLTGNTPTSYGIRMIKWNAINIFHTNVSRRYVGIGICPENENAPTDIVTYIEDIKNNNHNNFTSIDPDRYVTHIQGDCEYDL